MFSKFRISLQKALMKYLHAVYCFQKTKQNYFKRTDMTYMT